VNVVIVDRMTEVALCEDRQQVCSGEVGGGIIEDTVIENIQ
jgi:hypothetical protein